MRLRKKSHNLNRSDSTGSSSGRKFLAPTLSDPQTLRTDKYGQKKKSSNFMSTSASGGIVAGSSGITTPTGTRPRNQLSDHGRSKVLRPETTTESEEYEDTTGPSIPSTSHIATGAIAKHTLPPLPTDLSSVHFHGTTSQSMHGFDLQTSPYDGAGRSSNLNNNSSSTGSNIIPSTSKLTNNLMGSSSNTNVAYEVHDWWTDQVNLQSSGDDDDDYD